MCKWNLIFDSKGRAVVFASLASNSKDKMWKSRYLLPLSQSLAKVVYVVRDIAPGIFKPDARQRYVIIFLV